VPALNHHAKALCACDGIAPCITNIGTRRVWVVRLASHSGRFTPDVRGPGARRVEGWRTPNTLKQIQLSHHWRQPKLCFSIFGPVSNCIVTGLSLLLYVTCITQHFVRFLYKCLSWSLCRNFSCNSSSCTKRLNWTIEAFRLNIVSISDNRAGQWPYQTALVSCTCLSIKANWLDNSSFHLFLCSIFFFVLVFSFFLVYFFLSIYIL
jgi:hypothetical protein